MQNEARFEVNKGRFSTSIAYVSTGKKIYLNSPYQLIGAILWTKAKKSPKVEAEPTLSVTANKGDFHG